MEMGDAAQPCKGCKPKKKEAKSESRQGDLPVWQDFRNRESQVSTPNVGENCKTSRSLGREAQAIWAQVQVQQGRATAQDKSDLTGDATANKTKTVE